MFESKIKETWTRRFCERDIAFKQRVNGVFEVMNGRGILPSGITARGVQEVVEEELHTSGDEALKVLKDVHLVHGKKAKEGDIKAILRSLLHQRLQEVETYKVQELQKMLRDVASQPLLDAIDSQHKIERVQAEFELQIDLYLHEHNQAKGKNLKERIVNSLFDNPFIAVPAIILLGVAAIIGIVVAIKGFRIWNG
ncbi:hypothetical protein [Geomonas oryzae]|uniref:hypothetical protein n=1 Tax=Geomonas oryzae TaxID=2364273 RepID=UPI00100A454D|nr:hypothetical protein [Geomonas oryzae]